jgi:peptide/nickel transport system substrate-binding protein
MSRARIIGPLIVVAALAASARGELRPRHGGRMVGTLGSAPATVDPLAAQSYAEVVLAGLVFDTLYRLDEQGQPVPHLADGLPDVSSDGLTVTIRVRKGIRFHDNRALGASDVAASLKRAQNAQATQWALAPVKTIRRDGDTVVLALSRPTPELAALLAIPQLAITNAGKAPTTRSLIGTGPFKVTRVALDARKIELEAAKAHLGGRPYADAITLRWFEDSQEEARGYEAGDSHVSLHGSVVSAGRQPKHPTAAVDSPATILVYLGFGKSHPAIDSSVHFRRAVSLALNRDGFKRVGSGERVVPATLPESTDLGGLTPPANETVARAADATAELEKVDRPIPALELVIDETRPDDAQLATRIVSALDRAGVTVSITALSPKDFLRRVGSGQCDLYLGQLVAPTSDVVHEYAAAFAAGGDGWAVQRMEKGDLTRDAAAGEFAAKLPVVPLYHRAVRAHHRKTVVGLAFDAIGRLGWADASLAGGGDGP